VLPRIIPCLLLRRHGFVKTKNFRDPIYLGDPINIIRIFNEKEVDEVAILDIEASVQGRPPDVDYLRSLATECFMPLSYGGGIRNVEDARALFRAGFEKVCVNTMAVEKPSLVQELARRFGSSSVIVSIDVKKNWLGRYEVITRSGSKGTGLDPVQAARMAADNGAGEILLTSIDRDGTYLGYDLDLVRRVTAAVGIPVIACGGAGKAKDLVDVIHRGGASAAAAGSLFVFHGPHRAVLINPPSPAEIEALMLQYLVGRSS